MQRRRLVIILLAGALAGLLGVRPATSERAGLLTPSVTLDAHHDVSPPLRDLAARPSAATGSGADMPARDLPLGRRPVVAAGVSGRQPPASRPPVAAPAPVPAAAMPGPLGGFEGISNTDNGRAVGFLPAPPDAEGDVGPNHYVQWVNLSLAVWDKAGGLLLGPVRGNVLWSGFGGPCESQNDGDPIVQYDHLADRWLLTQFAHPNGQFAGPYYRCLAVSTTADPTGQYFRYSFLISETVLDDYAKFGVWPDAYYMSANGFAFGGEFTGVLAGAFERAQMLRGAPARLLLFDIGAVSPRSFGLLPADLDGPPPASGTPNPFTELQDVQFGQPVSALAVWEFHVDWRDPAASTFGAGSGPTVLLPTAPFDSNLCFYSQACIPQPQPGQRLDAIADRLMYRLQYRNFGRYQTLVVNHTVDVDGTDHAGIRWYELRNVERRGWFIFQQGDFAPDAAQRWMGSAAMDAAGNIAVGYSVSSDRVFPSIRWAGRFASDPPGQLARGEASLIEGGGAQTGTTRWGDYTVLALDPDGCTFWYTNEYYPATSDRGWRTRIGSFRFPACAAAAVAVADVRVTTQLRDTPLQVGKESLLQVDVANNGPDTAVGVRLVVSADAGVRIGAASVSKGGCTPDGGLICDIGTLAPGERVTVTVPLTPTAGGPLTLSAAVTSDAGATIDPNPGNNTAAQAADVRDAVADLTLQLTDTPDPVRGDQAVTYMATVKNNGPDTATAVTLTLTPPDRATIVSMSPACTAATPIATPIPCSVGVLASGAAATVSIIVRPSGTGTLTLRAAVTSATPDPNPGNNRSTESTRMLGLGARLPPR